jgi:hypothetical protein
MDIQPKDVLLFQYHQQPPIYDKVLDILNIVFTSLFTLEFICKLFVFRVKVKWYFDLYARGWNRVLSF